MDRKRGMKLRDLAGPLLLLTLLLAGLLGSWQPGRQQEAVARQLEDCQWLALSGQWQQARQGAEEARQQWQQHWKLWAALGDHRPMEEIDALFGQLKARAAAGDREEFAGISAELARRIHTMSQGQRLHWWNVL